MADERIAGTADDRIPLTLPALRVEVERLREELDAMRTALREEGKRSRTVVEEERAAAMKASHERDLERDRRIRLEDELRALRADIVALRPEKDGRVRAEERVAAIDKAAKLIERNLEAILDRREKSIEDKDRVIASLARALGSAEKERDILVEGPASKPATILRRLLGGRRVVAPAPRQVGAGTKGADAKAPAPASTAAGSPGKGPGGAAHEGPATSPAGPSASVAGAS